MLVAMTLGDADAALERLLAAAGLTADRIGDGDLPDAAGDEAQVLLLAPAEDRAVTLRALDAQGFGLTLQPVAHGRGFVWRVDDPVDDLPVLVVGDRVRGPLLAALADELRGELDDLHHRMQTQRIAGLRVLDALQTTRDAGRRALEGDQSDGGEATGLGIALQSQTRSLGALRQSLEARAALDAAPLIAPPQAWTRRARARVRRWTTPRLGVFYQQAPEPLRVARRTLRTRLPKPAPGIAVVTPSLGQGQFIERTLRSVLDQDYPALEYVVQDGGSTDGTSDVLRRYESRLARWTSEPDGGQADAINRGFAGTTGELMAYLNSDDLLLPGSLGWVADYMHRHPDVDAIYGQRMIVDEQDRVIGIWVTPPHDDAMLGLSNVVPQETLFWRRDAWDRVGGMDASFRFALDWDFLVRLRDSGARIVRANRYLGAFRVHGEQKSQAELRIGDAESDALRERVHGHPMTWEEATAAMRPYLRRHVLHHTAHRAIARLPLRRVAVRFD
jgi:hypothetical protein